MMHAPHRPRKERSISPLYIYAKNFFIGSYHILFINLENKPTIQFLNKKLVLKY